MSITRNGLLDPSARTMVSQGAGPRMRAENLPAERREEFSKYYPNGLPTEYKLEDNIRGHVPRRYVENNLPVGFYTNPPLGAPALFSTANRQTEFRKLEHILPQRTVHLWSRDEIQAVCNSLRKRFWDLMPQMQLPQCWDDLWTYFDAFDLYHYGSINLWNVINNLYAENKVIQADVNRERAVQIGQWVDRWTEDSANGEKLKSWSEEQGAVLGLLNHECWESLGQLSDDTIPLVAKALKHRRGLMMRHTKTENEPRGLMEACTFNDVENWLGTPQNKPKLCKIRMH